MSIHASAHDDEHDETVHHEEADIDVRAIFMAVIALTVMTALCYLTVWIMYRVMNTRADAAQVVRYPLALPGQEDRLPPQPRLQTDPKKDLKDLRDEAASALASYRWVDRNAGVVRIPIEEAMKLTVQRGLPSRPAAAPADKASGAAR
ncbi:MAG: hypothetical protein LBQ09_04810 [Acidobacteriaceae bacterium]|jgi:hypothetical protein|nr:hypothetical protein [Acidobacteriaceae bacterium]